jgi:hypothetical protein
MEVVDSADRAVNLAAEDIARRLTRRRVVSRGVKGAAALVAGLSVGGFAGVRSAFASNCLCSCDFPGCGECSCKGKSCPANGCPSGCVSCISTDCPGSGCIYSDGTWVCCTGCGRCGLGYYSCWDCRCLTCNDACGCKTDCRCAGCCSPAQVKEEMARDAALARASTKDLAMSA